MRVEVQSLWVPHATVQRVAHQRVAKMRQVNANLMTTARTKLHFQKRAAILHPKRADVRNRRLARASHAHAARIMAVTRARRVDGEPRAPRLGKRSFDDGVVALGKSVTRDEGIEGGLGLFRKREEHDARGFNVQPMERLGHRGTPLPYEVPLHAGCESLCGRAVAMDKQPHRFVNGKQERVLVEHRDGRGARRSWRMRRHQLERHLIARSERRSPGNQRVAWGSELVVIEDARDHGLRLNEVSHEHGRLSGLIEAKRRAPGTLSRGCLCG